MKKLLFVAIACYFVIFLGFKNADAQTWVSGHTPTDQDLNDIFFIDEDNGWAVGDNGVIIHSTDGGLNWSAQNSNITKDLTSVHFKSATEGYAVGKQGAILRTIDGGLSWVSVSISGYKKDLNFIGFSSADHGWILASHASPASDSNLVITRNGGNVWADTTGPILYKLQAACFKPGFIWMTGLASLHTIAFSKDDGKTWVDTLGKSLTDNLLSIFFINPAHGWVCNDRGKIWTSADTGKTWSQQITGLGPTVRINDLAFANQNTGWAATQNGLLYTSTGGSTWELKASQDSWYSLYVLNSTKAWGAGENGSVWIYRVLTDEVVADQKFKDQLLADTWRYLRKNVKEYLPEGQWLPEAERMTSCSRIEDIGCYLVARIGALELWNLNWATTKDSLLKVLELLDTWQSNPNDSYQKKLFYAVYKSSVSPATAASDSVPSLGNAYLAASLVTLKGFLSQNKPEDYQALAAYCNQILQRMDFSLWYDTVKFRFFKGGKNNPADGDYWEYLSDEGRILPFIARVLAIEYGLDNFSDLDFSNCFKSYTQFPAEYDGITIDKVNSDGSLASYFGPGLFIQEHTLSYNDIRAQAVQAQIRYALNKGYPLVGISDYLTYDIFEDCIGILRNAGCPPYGDSESRGDSSQIVPYASALALMLMTEDTTEIWNNLYAMQFLYPELYIDSYGFREYVDLADESIAEVVNYHSQLLIFLSLLNLKNGFVWKAFYGNPSVQQVHNLYSPFVPVELVLFQAEVASEGIHLQWRTASESNNYGFEVMRSFDGRHYSKIGFLSGSGTTAEVINYAFVDTGRFFGTAFYQLKQIDGDGRMSYSHVIKITRGGPLHFTLQSAYPNPFNPETKIQFSLPEHTRVLLVIYNDSGHKVATLLNEALAPGLHNVTWNGHSDDGISLPSGIYFYKIQAGAFSAARRVVLIR